MQTHPVAELLGLIALLSEDDWKQSEWLHKIIKVSDAQKAQFKADYDDWYLTAPYISTTPNKKTFFQKLLTNAKKIIPRWLNMSCARRPTQKRVCSRLSLLISPFYHPLCTRRKGAHALQMENGAIFFPLLPPARRLASLRSFHNKDSQMFSRLDGSSRCVAAPSASWITSWQASLQSLKHK